jgi:hypothetical protein
MQAPPITTVGSHWSVPFQSDPPAEVARLSPLSIDERWRPLGQTWLTGAPEPEFHPGWAQIHWSPGALHFATVFVGSAQRNRAQKLNERTWELGDVCEIFLQVVGETNYLELHITPENQRLQLLWPANGLERFRRNDVPLENFLINQVDWVWSSTRVGPGFWSAHITVPWSCVGIHATGASLAFRAAVCRYDYGDNSIPTYSSTAPLREPNFHRSNEWSPLKLIPEPPDNSPAHASKSK